MSVAVADRGVAAAVNTSLRSLENDGYYVFEGILSPDFVLPRRAEMATLLDQDVAYRAREQITGADHTAAGYSYSLTPEMHTMLFPAFQSKAAADIIEAVLTNAVVEQTIERAFGRHYRMRVDLVRRASGIDDGIDDFQLPHEWHRDTPGEFTLGVFLDDMSPAWSGGTTVLTGGTHYLPYDPIWDFMFGEKSYTTKKNYIENKNVFIRPECRKIEFFNDMVKRRLIKRVEEIRGKVGDVYLFMNDVWHGRAPNKQGKQFMTMRFGGFPSDFAFKNDLPLPGPIDILPPRLREAYRADQPVNDRSGLLVHRAREGRPDILTRLARWEKSLAVACTEAQD